MPDEGDSLARDLARETWKSFVATPRWAQWTLVIAAIVYVVASVGLNHVAPHAVLASIRVAAFVALIVGLIENAKTVDEFYMRVYLDACTISLIVSSVILYAGSNFGYEFGIRAVAVIAATFVLGFVVAFARLRRHA